MKKSSLPHNLLFSSLRQLLRINTFILFNYSILEELTFSFRAKLNTNMQLLHSLWLQASFSLSTSYKLQGDGKI